jgi:hypothetical protein
MIATYLIRRNGRYHFRMRVPQDLLVIIQTKEIHRSLGTTDGRTVRWSYIVGQFGSQVKVYSVV